MKTPFDTMYAYISYYLWSAPHKIEEVKIIAMRVKDGHLELATCALNTGVTEIFNRRRF